MILEYIKADQGCNKTNVKDDLTPRYIAANTADKIIKELIEVDRKVTCKIDDVNPE